MADDVVLAVRKIVQKDALVDNVCFVFIACDRDLISYIDRTFGLILFHLLNFVLLSDDDFLTLGCILSH